MTLRTFQFRTGGGYEVREAAAVEGAFHTVFDEDWKHLTLLTPDTGLAAAMGMGECGLVPNLEADISATGCAAWRPVEMCGEDHDLFAMTAEGGLHFGVRPADNDMCTADRLPAALLPAVVRRGAGLPKALLAPHESVNVPGQGARALSGRHSTMSFVRTLATLAAGYAAAKGMEKYKEMGGMAGVQKSMRTIRRSVARPTR
jgi:hypothetical protein